GKPNFLEIACAWVPFPAPGGPTKTMYTGIAFPLANKQGIIVAVQLKLSFDVEESISHNAHHDQQTGGGGQQRAVLAQPGNDQTDQPWQDGYEAQEQGSRQRNPAQDFRKILLSRCAAAHTRNLSADTL